MRASFLLALMLLVTNTALYAAPETPAPPANPFRLIFRSYDGNPDTDKIEKFSFQVETLDKRQPSEFLKLGETIPKTRLKIVNFVFKTAWDAKVQEFIDVSELTIENIGTGKTAILTFNKVVDLATANAPAEGVHK